MNILFIYLDAFSQVGGIQSYNKAFMKALQQLDEEEGSISFKAISLYDLLPDIRYIKSSNYAGFRSNKPSFAVKTISESFKSDLIVLGHINLAPIGLLFKYFKKQVYLVVHGVDVWENLSYLKKKFLLLSDVILSVSEFTKGKLIENYSIDPQKILLFPNTIDPYFDIPVNLGKPVSQLNKYNIGSKNKIILTVSRLSSRDKYKGYDKVITILPELKNKFPDIKYFIVGDGDSEEVARIKNLVCNLNLENDVVLTGFVRNEELRDYYLLSDVYVMPSMKEGFGIVYLEALACGIPVIAGNKDGSQSALLGGELGLLIDPDNQDELKDAILKVLTKKVPEKYLDRNFLSRTVNEKFGYENFKYNMKNILQNMDRI